MKPVAAKRSEIRSLTSLRGIAAFAVVLQHFAATFQGYCTDTFPSPAPHGYMAVDFFFALSGFIMCYTYLDNFEARRLQAYGPFMAKRFGRIFPLHTSCVLFVLLLGWLSAQIFGRNPYFEPGNIALDTVANIFMLQGLGVGQNLNGPSWSISTEFFAYFVFPLLILVVFRGTLRLAAAVLAAALGLVWVASRSAGWHLGATDTVSGLTRCMAGFVLGMAAYRLYRNVPRLATFLGRSEVAVAVAGAAALSLVLRTDLPAAMLFPLIVVAFAVNDGLPAKLLSIKPVYFLGVISFSLYLIHNPFRPIALGLLQWASPEPISPIAAFLLTIVASICIVPFATLTYRLVERPGRETIRALVHRATPVRAVRAVSTGKYSEGVG